MIPMELLYLLAALGLGFAVYRYFTGHGGLQVSRVQLGDLPADGEVDVRGHQVRWSSADDDSFAAVWPLANGHVVSIRVLFDADADADDPEADPDQGLLELALDKRRVARGVTWTDQIRDRSLRADVEAVLKALAREAKGAKRDTRRVAGARPVGDERKIGE
jgi:hypothetical protein